MAKVNNQLIDGVVIIETSSNYTYSVILCRRRINFAPCISHELHSIVPDNENNNMAALSRQLLPLCCCHFGLLLPPVEPICKIYTKYILLMSRAGVRQFGCLLHGCWNWIFALAFKQLWQIFRARPKVTATVSLARAKVLFLFLYLALGKWGKKRGMGFEIALTGSQALPLHSAETNIDYASA